jgi:NADH dehydrogenase
MLRERGKPVRGLCRTTCDPVKQGALEAAGVEIAVGNLRDRASLDQAVAGADTVITTVSVIGTAKEGDDFNTVDREGNIALIEAAKAAGVQHFIFISALTNTAAPRPNPLADAKDAVEAHLKASGLTYTILRPVLFMEVWLSPALGFDYVQGKPAIFGSGDQKLSYISLVDVARFAVEAIDNPAGRNASIDLGGPEALSPNEVVRIFEEASGRKFEPQHVPAEAFLGQYAAASNPFEQTIASLSYSVTKDTTVDMTQPLRDFRIQLTSVRDYARRVVQRQ